MRPLTVLLSFLALIALAHMIAVAQTPDATVAPTDCAGLIHTTDYSQVVHLQPTSQEMQAIQFVNQLTAGQPTALVQVTHQSTNQSPEPPGLVPSSGLSLLDIYVYGCTTQKHSLKLTALFTHRNLVQGAVSISQANTLITSELDPTLSPQASIQLQPLQQNIYHEYVWQNGTFVQVPSPSLYPVISRSEAELLQQQANNGTSLLWDDPVVTAQQMANDLLKWPSNQFQATLLSNNDTSAHVLLTQQNPHLEVTVTLTRLIQHNNTGLWFVVGAQTQGITLDRSHLLNPFISPITLQGTGALSDGQTSATLFDHTLTPIHTLNDATLTVGTSSSYTGTIYYSHVIPNQQGVLLIESLPSNTSSEEGQLLLTGIILG